jgi:hypothetical protein
MDNLEIDKNGTKLWKLDGKYHRDDGPAIEWANGGKSWYQHGKYHRDDGPAIDVNGDKSWYQHGKRHRDDGPAIIYANGDKYWYQHDHALSFDEWLDEVDMSNEDKVMMKLHYG